MDINEPVITRDQVLFLDEADFNNDNVIVVTGAATGIGRATAVAGAANGLMAVGLDINEDEGKKTVDMARQLGGEMIFINCDLSRDEDMDAAVAEAAKLGTIKYLINVAGLQHIDYIEDFPMEKYDFMQRVMTRAPFYLAKLCIPHMKGSSDGRGVVGNMSSAHGHISTLAKSSYNISKFAMRALSQSISAEGEGKVRSFSVSTAFVKTPLALNQIPAQATKRGITHEEVVREVMCGRTRVKEMMEPIEVGNLFMFGISHWANYLVGGDLLFDGGMVLTY